VSDRPSGHLPDSLDILVTVYRLMNAVGSDTQTDDEVAAYREMYDLLTEAGFDMSNITPYE